MRNLTRHKFAQHLPADAGTARGDEAISSPSRWSSAKTFRQLVVIECNSVGRRPGGHSRFRARTVAGARERILDAFYTTKAVGLGIGLSISRSIAKAHGGRLWASAIVPYGAAFQFTLHAGPSPFSRATLRRIAGFRSLNCPSGERSPGLVAWTAITATMTGPAQVCRQQDCLVVGTARIDVVSDAIRSAVPTVDEITAVRGSEVASRGRSKVCAALTAPDGCPRCGSASAGVDRPAGGHPRSPEGRECVAAVAAGSRKAKPTPSRPQFHSAT